VAAAAALWPLACGGSGDDRVFDDNGGGSSADCGACPAARLCDADFGCVRCLTSADCATGESCRPRDHECKAACASDADCTDDEAHCDGRSGECFECVVDAQCADSGKAHCATSHECVKCVVDADCGDPSKHCEDFNCKG
jgi:hypothetical protein